MSAPDEALVALRELVAVRQAREEIQRRKARRSHSIVRDRAEVLEVARLYEELKVRESRAWNVARRLAMSGVRPLSAHALAELHALEDEMIPRNAMNPGVVGHLLSEGLVEIVQAPSPYTSHKGRQIEHLRLTDTGRVRLRPAPSL